MKLLKKRNIVIDPQCISHIWFNSDSSKVSAYLSCSGEAAGSCLVESEGKVDFLKYTEISFLGEDAEAFIRLMAIL